MFLLLFKHNQHFIFQIHSKATFESLVSFCVHVRLNKSTVQKLAENFEQTFSVDDRKKSDRYTEKISAIAQSVTEELSI